MASRVRRVDASMSWRTAIGSPLKTKLKSNRWQDHARVFWLNWFRNRARATTTCENRRGSAMNVFTKFRETAAAIGFRNAVLFAASRVSRALFGRNCRIVKYYITAQPVVVPDPARWMLSGTFELAGLAPIVRFSPRPIGRQRSSHPVSSRERIALLPSARGGSLASSGSSGPYDEDEVRVRFVPAPPGTRRISRPLRWRFCDFHHHRSSGSRRPTTPFRTEPRAMRPRRRRSNG